MTETAWFINSSVVSLNCNWCCVSATLVPGGLCLASWKQPQQCVWLWWRDAPVSWFWDVITWLVQCTEMFWIICVRLPDFSPDPGGSPECGSDESDWSQDALHSGLAIPARVWNHPLPGQVSSFLFTWFLLFTWLLLLVSCLVIFGSRFGHLFSHFQSSLAVVSRFQGGKKEELIGITYNRLIRMDAHSGDAIKTWRFSNMKQWNVNWEIKMVTVHLWSLTFVFRSSSLKNSKGFWIL